MEAMMLLCDYAEVINGKFYIMGGGWTSCPPGRRNMAVAVRVLVQWDETNVKNKLSLVLQDEDGKTVEIGEPPRQVRQDGDFEVGRPPGVPRGTELDFAIVFGFTGLALLPERGYRWQLEINGEPICHASFRSGAEPSQ
ncbi:MAG: hypothetical protein PHP64_03870 [Actinomycetota bacterium]|nr:hypothetical protein [Actinomycetota bacterium]